MLAFLLLGSFLTAIVHATTPEEVSKGNIPGYIEGNPPLQGDYLISTFCYCAESGNVTGGKDEAHFFQFEYYNFHLRTTYIVYDLCLASKDDTSNCLQSLYVGDHDLIAVHQSSQWQGTACRTWRRESDMFTEDTVCYRSHAYTYYDAGAFLLYNRQKRDVGGPTGDQGFKEVPSFMANQKCTAYCEDHAGMHVLNDTTTPNRIIFYDDVDDMCDTCR